MGDSGKTEKNVEDSVAGLVRRWELGKRWPSAQQDVGGSLQVQPWEKEVKQQTICAPYS